MQKKKVLSSQPEIVVHGDLYPGFSLALQGEIWVHMMSKGIHFPEIKIFILMH